MVANNGATVTSTNPVYITGNTATFSINTYGSATATMTGLSCTGGASGSLNGTMVTVNNITQDATCTINYNYTFTMNSVSCPDKIYSNASPCFVIKNNSTTATYGGKEYSGCTPSAPVLKSQSNCSVYLLKYLISVGSATAELGVKSSPMTMVVVLMLRRALCQ